VNQPTVLLICEDAEFSKALRRYWGSRPDAPAFIVAQPDVCQGIHAEDFEVAIIGPVEESKLAGLLENLRPKPLIAIVTPGSATIRQEFPRAVFLPQDGNWRELVTAMAAEMLKCSAALNRAIRAEQARSRLECHATLGKYMIEMRHTLNNALTSVLGNSELLLLEPGALSASARPQVDTMRNMAVRMHEILQRFTSIEKELSAVERQTDQPQSTPRTAISGGSGLH
jgi:signal transduction histidine kinase